MLIRGGKHSSYLTTILAFIFCFLNAYSIAEELLVYHVYPKNDFFSLRFLIGVIIFFTGFILNLQADSILRNLRKDDSQRDYKIPRGDYKRKIWDL
jgi:steroid 5-alpha reductase family enzyme